MAMVAIMATTRVGERENERMHAWKCVQQQRPWHGTRKRQPHDLFEQQGGASKGGAGLGLGHASNQACMHALALASKQASKRKPASATTQAHLAARRHGDGGEKQQRHAGAGSVDDEHQRRIGGDGSVCRRSMHARTHARTHNTHARAHERGGTQKTQSDAQSTTRQRSYLRQRAPSVEDDKAQFVFLRCHASCA
jgi:hypothetical protein